MNKSLCALLSITMLLTVSPAARCEDNSGRLLSQKPAAPAAPAALAAPAAPAAQLKSLNTNEVGLGERLTITGTGFSTTQRDNNVSIGDKNAQILQSSATSITVTVPKDVKAGKQKVMVTVKTAKSNTLEVTIVGPPPELDSLSLSSAAPGASLTLSGKNFSPTAQENKVTIGGAHAQVTSASTSSISVMIPHDIESPQEASVSVEVGRQKAKNSLQIMIQSREY